MAAKAPEEEDELGSLNGLQVMHCTAPATRPSLYDGFWQTQLGSRHPLFAKTQSFQTSESKTQAQFAPHKRELEEDGSEDEDGSPGEEDEDTLEDELMAAPGKWFSVYDVKQISAPLLPP